MSCCCLQRSKISTKQNQLFKVHSVVPDNFAETNPVLADGDLPKWARCDKIDKIWRWRSQVDAELL